MDLSNYEALLRARYTDPAHIGMATCQLSAHPQSEERSRVEVRASGAGADYYTIRGHASVFNKTTELIPGFTEEVAPGAFRNVLSRNPDVFLVVAHDLSRPLARTLAGSLELSEDPNGLRIWARVHTKASYAEDAKQALEHRLMDQMSFGFTIAEQELTEREDGSLHRRILQVGELWDTTICAMGAYPTTDVSLVREAQAPVEAMRAALSPNLTEHVAPNMVGDSSGDPAPATAEEAQRSHRSTVLLARARVAAKHTKTPTSNNEE